MIASTFPAMDKATVDAGVDALLALRASLLDAGIISHGVVNCPADDEADPAEVMRRVAETGDTSQWRSWHILSAVVTMPAIPLEVDTGELIARMLGQDLDPDASHVESFATEMGCGTGLILQPEFPSAADAAAAGGPAATDLLTDLDLDGVEPGPARYGLAVGLSTPLGGGASLLAVGMCMEPGQVLEVAALVAAIAGNSRVHPADAAAESP